MRITLRDLTKHFGGEPAVDTVSLDLAAGEFLTLLGPSGSGKSTTLNLLAGFERPDRGDILFDDRSVLQVPTNERNLGMVFQSYALLTHLSVAQNVAYPLKRRGVARAERQARVADALEAMQLSEHASRAPGELSGGQQQRVALARALVYRPAALLMDEPLGALDRSLRQQLQGEIARVHRETRPTVVYVTHDQEEALALSDRIAVMRGGRMEQVGTPAEIYDRPVSRFVGEFVGESTVVSFDRRAILLRPEQVTLITPETQHEGPRVDVTVTDVQMLGPNVRVAVQMQDGTPGVTRIGRSPAATRPDIEEVSVRVPGGNTTVADWRPGDAAVLAWRDGVGVPIEE